MQKGSVLEQTARWNALFAAGAEPLVGDLAFFFCFRGRAGLRRVPLGKGPMKAAGTVRDFVFRFGILLKLDFSEKVNLELSF